MTRITCIPVQELTDKHLMAEYFELPRVSGLIWKWHDKTGLDLCGQKVFVHPKLPKTYRIGKGHVTFFYDKGEFLRKRFEEQIVPEMQRRGFTTNFTQYRVHPKGFNKDWQPTEGAMEINRQRIQERLNAKTTKAS